MKKIHIKDNVYAVVDDEDFDNLNQYKWSLVRGYAKRMTWDSKTKKVGNLTMHQIVLGKKDGFEIDHINRNRLDNRKQNLRHVTKSQNRMNTPVRADSKTGVKGVTLYKGRDKKYGVRIRNKRNGKLLFLGSFYTLKEASSFYNKKAIEMNGEYACVN